MASGDSSAGVLVKVRNAGMQGQNFLCLPWFLETQLTLLLFPGLAVGLFNQVIAASRGNDLDVFHGVEHIQGSNGRPVTPELIGVNDVWNVLTHQ